MINSEDTIFSPCRRQVAIVSPMNNQPATPAPQLCMIRRRLDDLPVVELPEGYAIRTYRDGDGKHWAGILRESFKDDSFDEARFDREMKAHPAFRPDRIFFVCSSDGSPCGTASAYRQESFGNNTGYLHYVAVCPAHAGKRLGTAVSIAVLNKFRSEGFSSAVLQTDDFRLAAIRTYLRLGFTPLMNHESHPGRWDIVLGKLR